VSARNPNEYLAYGYSAKDWDAFSKETRWRIKHPEKQKAASQKWVSHNYQYNIARQRQYQLKAKYNITEADYLAILEKQNFMCAICDTKTPTGKWKVFAVDHDHATGKVRGLLCNECNRGIGLLKDSLSILSSAFTYLEKHLD
jgi:hypothetical protein